MSISRDDFIGGLTSVPAIYLCFALFLTAMNYCLYIGYDILALRYIRRSLPLRRVALVSFLGFSLGNNLGTFLAGAPIRFRFYGRWGLSASQIVALIGTIGISFWSGVWLLGGVVLLWNPVELPPQLHLPVGTRTLGVVLLTLGVGYGVVCLVWRKPWPIGKMHLRLPTPGLMAVQASVAAVDLVISSTVLYLVLPGNAVVPFGVVLAAFMVGIAVSLITQVPGGLGVLELVVLSLLRPSVGDAVLASVLIFRCIYYLLPLLFGMATLVGHEIFNGAVEARSAKRAVLNVSRVIPDPSLSPQEND